MPRRGISLSYNKIDPDSLMKFRRPDQLVNRVFDYA